MTFTDADINKNDRKSTGILNKVPNVDLLSLADQMGLDVTARNTKALIVERILIVMNVALPATIPA